MLSARTAGQIPVSVTKKTKPSANGTNVIILCTQAHRLLVMRACNMKEITGKQRLERLYKRLKKNYPDKDIRLTDETLVIDDFRLLKFKVSYWKEWDGIGYQVCDAIWGDGLSYGYESGLLEFYGGDGEPEGSITELRAYNLFKKFIDGQ